jgi:hypothetical protein
VFEDLNPPVNTLEVVLWLPRTPAVMRYLKLSAQHYDLGFISGILKQYQIVSIQTIGPMLGCSIKEILRDVIILQNSEVNNDTGISMVHFALKPIHDGFYGLNSHHVIKDEQMTGAQIGHQFLVV